MLRSSSAIFRVRAPFFVWMAVVALWFVPPFAGAFHGMVKVGGMKLPYAMTFLLLMFPVIVAISAIQAKGWAGAVTRLMVGGIGAHVCSVMALLVADDVANGWGTTARAAGRYGWDGVLLVDFWVAFVILGWLLGIVAAALVILLKRFDPASGSV